MNDAEFTEAARAVIDPPAGSKKLSADQKLAGLLALADERAAWRIEQERRAERFPASPRAGAA